MFILKIIIVFGVLFPVSSFAKGADLKSRLVGKIKRAGFAPKDSGSWVKGDSAPMNHNGDRAFVPASLSKIPTALATLANFPMNHKFYTWVKSTGKIKGGTLEGDLYLQGGETQPW